MKGRRKGNKKLADSRITGREKIIKMLTQTPYICISLPQDTPAVKVKYSAEVRAPLGLTVLMSALREGHQQEEGQTTFK